MHPVVIFLLFGIVIVLLAILGQRAAAQRQQALRDWAVRSGLSFRDGRDGDIEARYPLFVCFRQGTDRYAENVMQGRPGGRDVCAFDYHYETTSTDSKGRTQKHDHWFSAVVFETDHPLRALSIRPEGFFDRITEFFGADDIDFELAEFSRAFYVKAEERRWAFDVLHQETMEFLLGQPRFRIEMGGRWLLVRRLRRLDPEEFGAALETGAGILDRLPRYLLRELKGEDG